MASETDEYVLPDLPFGSFRPSVLIVHLEPMTFRRWVMNHRLRLGLTLEQASEESGVPASTLHRIESGKPDVRLSTLVPLLKWLNRVRE